MRQRRLIERALERTHEGVDLRLRRTPDAGRRHQAATQLAHHFFPDVRMRRHVREIQVSRARSAVFVRWLWHVMQ